MNQVGQQKVRAALRELSGKLRVSKPEEYQDLKRVVIQIGGVNRLLSPPSKEVILKQLDEAGLMEGSEIKPSPSTPRLKFMEEHLDKNEDEEVISLLFQDTVDAGPDSLYVPGKTVATVFQERVARLTAQDQLELDLS
jgi:hypothetical protein